MTDREQSFTVLLALFDLTRAGLSCTRERLAGRLGMRVASVEGALDRLGSVGLVRGARLTLEGLALASSLDATRASMGVLRAA